MSFKQPQLIPFTPTGSWVNNTTYSGFYKIDGDMLHITYKIALTGAPNATDLTLNLPPGFKVRLVGSQEQGEGFLSHGTIGDPGVAFRAGLMALYNNVASIGVFTLDSGTAINQVNATRPQTFGNSDSVHLHVSLPFTRV